MYGFGLFIVLELMIALQWYFAWRDRAVHLIRLHTGIWGDVVIISPLVAYLFHRHHDAWRPLPVLLAILISAIIMMVAERFWANGSQDLPDAMVRDNRTTRAGIVHLAYIIPTLSVILLFYTSTPLSDVTKAEAFVVCLSIGIHLLIGFPVYEQIMKDSVSSMTWSLTAVLWVITACMSARFLK